MSHQDPASEEGEPTIVPPAYYFDDDSPSSTELRKLHLAHLDYRLKRASAYGGLTIAGALYAIGVMVVLRQMGIWPFDCIPISDLADDVLHMVECPVPGADTSSWHVFIAIMIALFSVPTVLVISILRGASAKKDVAADNAYSLVGEKLMGVVDSLLGRKK
ncbi:MAG: hypothetical protein J7598_18295 [Mitsuaria chitosanitabida]|uniref:hypothetical protein n=1 Tax=Roseateles chitosanitabidus TaxID=65048 RepID=UPI001B1382C1|nr:hypothetical protein [Roseateles chitosanitabidus]MBO9688556.1 hypothetical protein [Roseateles chitosanitabidus]